MSLAQRATLNASWSVISEVVPRVFVLFVSIYLARTLSTASFGVLALAQAYPQFLATSLEMGVAMYGTRELARDRSGMRDLFSGLLSLRITVAAGALALYAIAVIVLVDEANRPVFLACGLFLLAYAGSTDWVQRAHERFELTAAANIVGALILVTGCVLLVREPSQVLLAAALWSVSYLATTALSLGITGRALKLPFRPLIAPARWWQYLRSSIFFSLSGLLAVGMYQASVGVLGATWPAESVAHFAAPYRLVMAVATTGYFVPLGMYPLFSTLVDQREAFAALSSTVTRLLLAFGLPLALICASLGPAIVDLVLGPSYVDAGSVLLVLCPLIPLQLLIYVLEITLLARHRERLRALVNLLGLAVAVALAPLLIPPLGSIGAAAVYVSAVMTLAIGLLVAYRSTVGQLPMTLLDVLRLLVPAAAMSLLLPWNATSLEILRPVLAVALYAVTALATGLIRPAELRWLTDRMRRLPNS